MIMSQCIYFVLRMKLVRMLDLCSTMSFAIFFQPRHLKLTFLYLRKNYWMVFRNGSSLFCDNVKAAILVTFALPLVFMNFPIALMHVEKGTAHCGYQIIMRKPGIVRY
ncbi:hypothetical protein SAY87_018889 [Trapa incisa]|uniref:Uncharacterized protein n=1 Tax=Trapa incisa TaxID=236973 RepID=A0AAN7JYC6_9MYRT|nr:hypothetical protein SAY87_018889 [Trapa incisa]